MVTRVKAGLAVLLTLLSLFSCRKSITTEGGEDNRIPWVPIEPVPVPMYFNLDKTPNQMEITLTDENVYEIGITGAAAYDPYTFVTPLENDLEERCTVLSFEYKSDTDIDFLELFMVNTSDNGPQASKTVRSKSLPAASEWTPVGIRLKKEMAKFEWGKKGDWMRMDFGEKNPGKPVSMQIRDFKMRGNNSQEQEEEDKENAIQQEKEEYEKSINDYLSKQFSCKVTGVRAGESSVEITLDCPADGQYFLAELPPYADIFRPGKIAGQYRHEITSATISLPRKAELDGVMYDRLLSKWAIYRNGDQADELASQARYADPDMTAPVTSPQEVVLKGKKGLGGLIPHELLDTDIDELGLSSGTINVNVLEFMSMQPGAGYIAHEYCGETFYFNEPYITGHLDAVLSKTSAKGIAMAGIILISPTAEDKELLSLLKHPDYTSGSYSMPNMTTPESVRAYAALIDFLTSRYSDPSKRISHWIIHNEVDGGNQWTNMGNDVMVATYTDTYVKSMRMFYNILHQYDQNAQVMISLSHGWDFAAGNGWYKVTDMLNLLNGYSRAEGDFFWSLAYHSYPTILADPTLWDDKEASYSMKTKYVTMTNLEVLDKWVKTPENMYKGSIMRKAWLSEAGVSSGPKTSGTYSETMLKNQAAGFAYAWKKINALEGIAGIQWHNWFDVMAEDAQLGLRKYSESDDPSGPKPVYYTYKNAGTSDEESFFTKEGYLQTMGFSSWDEIFHTVE